MLAYLISHYRGYGKKALTLERTISKTRKTGDGVRNKYNFPIPHRSGPTKSAG